MAPNPAETANAKPPPSTIEFEPPLACVRRILKHSLPDSTNVGKDASTAFARACGIFIIYVTSCANDFARESKRQTITANDVLAAVQELEFGEFVPDMTACLEQYRQAEKSKKDAKAAAAKAKVAAATTTNPSSSSPVKGGEEEEDRTGQGEEGKEEEDEEDGTEEVSAAAVEDAKAPPPAEKRPREEETTSNTDAEEKNSSEEPQAKRPKTNDETPVEEG